MDKEDLMTAWEHARELVGSCFPLLPPGTAAEFGRFIFDSRSVPFGYQILPDDESGEGPRLVTVDFLPDSDAFTKENMMALGVVANGRSYFLLADSIYDEPVLFNKVFPAFFYHWKKEGDRGLLRFLRIDFSDDDFINYEGEDLPRAMTMGDDNLFKTLPGALAGLTEILGMPIPHEIDFEKHAGEIAGLAHLKTFSQACRDVSS